MGCSANVGINWQFVWTVQPTGQEKVQGRNVINAVTKDFLPSYDKLLVALCPILESLLARTALELPNTARIFFFSLDNTPHLAWKPKLHYPVMILSGAISFHSAPPHHILIRCVLI
jgi:hypothetical protein